MSPSDSGTVLIQRGMPASDSETLPIQLGMTPSWIAEGADEIGTAPIERCTWAIPLDRAAKKLPAAPSPKC